MRDRSHVFDHGDFEACGLQCTDGGFTAGARAFDVDFDGLHSTVDSNFGGSFRCGLCCEGSGLFGTSEAHFTGARPGNSVALRVGDGDDGVVEGGLDMGRATFDYFTVAASAGRSVLLGTLFSQSVIPLKLLLLVSDGLFRTLACTGVRLGTLTSDGETFSMANATVRTDFDESLDVQSGFPTKITFDLKVVVNVVTKLGNILLGKISYTSVGVDAGSFDDIVCSLSADAMDIGESDLDSLVSRQVDT